MATAKSNLAPTTPRVKRDTITQAQLVSQENEEPNVVNKKEEFTATPLNQQELPGWEPEITPRTMYPYFLVYGSICFSIGVALFFSNNHVQEISVDYTNCAPCVATMVTHKCNCTTRFALSAAIPKNVYVYYALTRFHQNHRKYVASRDDSQLLGTNYSTSANCEIEKTTKEAVLPCGTIAETIFNDTFRLYYIHNNLTRIEIPMNNTGIAWSSDIYWKFMKLQTPRPLNKPTSWILHDPFNTSNQWPISYENFIVWMRPAAFPDFKKLMARIDHGSKHLIKDGLPKGKYLLEIVNNFPVKGFEGRKSFVLSNTYFLGGKNNGISIIYMVTGALYFILGIVCIFLICVKPQRVDVKEPDLETMQETPDSETVL